jgi:hypothetical protein
MPQLCICSRCATPLCDVLNTCLHAVIPHAPHWRSYNLNREPFSPIVHKRNLDAPVHPVLDSAAPADESGYSDFESVSSSDSPDTVLISSAVRHPKRGTAARRDARQHLKSLKMQNGVLHSGGVPEAVLPERVVLPMLYCDTSPVHAQAAVHWTGEGVDSPSVLAHRLAPGPGPGPGLGTGMTYAGVSCAKRVSPTRRLLATPATSDTPLDLSVRRHHTHIFVSVNLW